jgi:DNA-binding transcriptional ArsR family regulator
MYACDNVARTAVEQVPLPSNSQVEAATLMLRMLADGTRLRLMWLLCHGERDVTTLTREIGVARPAISQHLAKLRLAGLVTTHRAGRQVYYTVRHGHIRRLVTEAMQAADHQISGVPDHP